MKQLFERMVAASAVAVALAGYADIPSARADDGKEPIVFLAAVIQSGPFKVTDGQNLAGIQFAVDEINAKGGIGGRSIKLDVIDTELNAAVTRRKTIDSVLQDHVSVIIGASGSDVLSSLVSVGQQYHVPVRSPSPARLRNSRGRIFNRRCSASPPTPRCMRRRSSTPSRRTTRM